LVFLNGSVNIIYAVTCFIDNPHQNKKNNGENNGEKKSVKGTGVSKETSPTYQHHQGLRKKFLTLVTVLR
jgi:hypothetical protein